MCDPGTDLTPPPPVSGHWKVEREREREPRLSPCVTQMTAARSQLPAPGPHSLTALLFTLRPPLTHSLLSLFSL